MERASENLIARFVEDIRPASPQGVSILSVSETIRAARSATIGNDECRLYLQKVTDWPNDQLRTPRTFGREINVLLRLPSREPACARCLHV